MRLMRLAEADMVPAGTRSYRHARLGSTLVWLGVLAGNAQMWRLAISGRWGAGYVFAPFLSLFLLLTLRYVTARYHGSNWLVRADDAGLAIQFRSYLNRDLPVDQPTVLELGLGEIASARMISEKMRTPAPSHYGAARTEFRRYVELELRGSTAGLQEALHAERATRAPMIKRWYGGSSSTLYQDYPVTFDRPPFLRIRWDVVPRAGRFLESLRPRVALRDPVSLTVDFTTLKSASPTEQRERLRDLANRGEAITAFYLAQQLYGGSWAEAKAMVERLQTAN